jgi:hypothetical protein
VKTPYVFHTVSIYIHDEKERHEKQILGNYTRSYGHTDDPGISLHVRHRINRDADSYRYRYRHGDNDPHGDSNGNFNRNRDTYRHRYRYGDRDTDSDRDREHVKQHPGAGGEYRARSVRHDYHQ